MSLAGAATSIIFVTTKHVFCRDKSMLVATKLCLSRQKSAPILSRQNQDDENVLCDVLWRVVTKKIFNQDCRIIKCAHAHSLVENKVRGRK